MRPIRSEGDVEDLLRGAKALAVLSAWNELKLFDLLADGPRTLDELPADRRALETTVPVLKHLGLLRGDGDRIALSSIGAELLAKGQLPTARNFEFLESLGQMARVLRDGGPLDPDDATDGGVRVHDPERTATFLDMLHRRSAQSVEICFEWLSPLMPAGARILDVGGGHGRYVRRFVDEGHSGVVFDFPHVVDYARGKHAEVLDYIAGNFREDADFGGPYDLILLSNIVHGEPEAENRLLLKRLAQTLAPGGYIVLKDMFLDALGAHPQSAVFFGLTMLFYTRAGQSPTLAQATEWLQAAGLADVRLGTFEGFQLVRARRPD